MMIMEKNERIIAITRILPGLEAFLREVLASENLSPEAEKQRLDFVKELEQLTKPPTLPPRPTNLKTQSRASVDSIDSVENADNDFASVQRKLSNIFYMRRDFDELNEHLVNGFATDEANKGPRKAPAKIPKQKPGMGIYEPLPGTDAEAEPEQETGVLSEEETPRFHNRSLPRGAHIRQSLSRGKWFAKKEKSMLQEVYACDLQLPTISGHLMEVRTNKRRWCVLKDQHLYIFKTQEEPALFQIALPGCDISTVPKSDKTKVSYSFKITQDGVAAVILGIEEEKDLSAWMNALITASLSKNPLSPSSKATKSLPRSMHIPWNEEGAADENSQRRRHTVGPSSKITKEAYVEIDIGTYEQPADVMGQAVTLDTNNYNPPLPLLPGEVSNMLEESDDHTKTRPLSKYSGIYEEVGDEFIHKYSMNPDDDHATDVNTDDTQGLSDGLTNGTSTVITNGRRSYSEVGTSDSEYSSDDDEHKDENGNKRLFHDRWAVHSGVLYQKRQTGWNRRYCKIVDNCLRGFRNPNDLTPVLELNLSACNVRAAEAEGKRRFIFQLNTAESESLYFNTDSEDSLDRWIEVISVAATSRLANSVTMSEDELDVLVAHGEQSTEEISDDRRGSRESIPSPVPERKESLRKPRVNRDSLGSAERKRDEETKPLPNDQYDKPEKLIAETKCEIRAATTECKANGNDEIWKKRDPHPSYATTPRAKPGAKIKKSASVKESAKTASSQSLDFSENVLESPQKALQLSKKRQYSERLKKYLDKDGQFSGFILELRVKKNSTTLTRRWAVVQNGFLRIYENYGCAAPFLRISLVEAFLKDFSNIAKSRFCFMLEYGAGQSILFQTNTHQELKRWINVITLTIACNTDLFGSGWDLTQREKIGDLLDGTKSLNRSVSQKKSKSQDVADVVDGVDVTTSHTVRCECNHDDEELACTPTVLREAIHRKSYSMSSSGSLDGDDVISKTANESFTYRTSLVHKVKHRGYLRILHGESLDGGKSCRGDTHGSSENDTKDYVLEFCELKGSLFSVYDSDKSENPKQVFNLLYDKYREVPNVACTFALTSDRTGTITFASETEENFEAWKQVINNTALQDDSNSDPADKTCGKCSSDSPIVRKRSSLRASFAEEEAKHHEVLRSLADDCTCDESPYSCYVYEVRDSSGNKTIIRRWCVVGEDLIRFFERETSREAVAELRPNTYRLKDIENPRGLPFAFKLQRLLPQEGEDKFLVIQASNSKDFRELLLRIKSIQLKCTNLVSSKSETNINTPKKPPLIHSKSDLSIRRIFALARKSSKDNLVANTNPPGHDTWPKVIRRERKTSRRALSDTSTGRPVTNSLIENSRDKAELRDSMRCHFLFDSEGKFSGYLTEVRNNPLCRSEVRKWCVIKNNKFFTFDDQNLKTANTVIDLGGGTELVDLSHVNPNSFEIRAINDVGHVYKAADDFQKWLTVLTLAIDMCHEMEQKGENTQVKSPVNGNVPGKSPERKSAGGKLPSQGPSTQNVTSEVPNVKRKYGRKDALSSCDDGFRSCMAESLTCNANCSLMLNEPSQITAKTLQAEDTAF